MNGLVMVLCWIINLRQMLLPKVFFVAYKGLSEEIILGDLMNNFINSEERQHLINLANELFQIAVPIVLEKKKGAVVHHAIPRILSQLGGFVDGLTFDAVALSILMRADWINGANLIFGYAQEDHTAGKPYDHYIHQTVAVLKVMKDAGYQPTREDGLQFNPGNFKEIKAQLT